MKCVLCDNTTFTTVAGKLRNNIPRKVVRCSRCSLVSLENPISNTVDYSAKEYRKLHSPVLGKTLSPTDMFDSQIQFQKNRIIRIRNLLKPKSIVLEIGCSTGHFLFSIKDMVKKVVGIELEPRYAEFARSIVKSKCTINRLEKHRLG